MKKQSVLFVCMGNICRSPSAQGVFESLLAESDLAGEIAVDSAGTHGYHTGHPPDERAVAAAKRRGIDLSQQRARTVAAQDLIEFDWVVAMDPSNRAHLQGMHSRSSQASARIVLMTEFAPDLGFSEVPDPYYGGADGFEQVLDLLEVACAGLLTRLRGDR